MAIVHFKVPVTKARRRRGAPPTDKQLEALGERMSSVFSLDLARGITKLQDSIPADVLEKAFRSGDYTHLTDSHAWANLEDNLADSVDRIGTTVQLAGKLAEDKLPKVVKENLDYDTRNPRLSDYLETRTGALIENVTDEMQQNVQIATRMAFEQGATQRDIADTVREQLRGSIGLNSRQAQALANYQGDDRAAYAERLLDQRAMMIARTEVSFAMNQGQLDVWGAAKDQGLLSDSAKKVWVCDGAPCPFICEPMDGMAVGLDEDFTAPDGSTCPGPPIHPNCYCTVAIDIGDAAGAKPSSADEDADE